MTAPQPVLGKTGMPDPLVHIACMFCLAELRIPLFAYCGVDLSDGIEAPDDDDGGYCKTCEELSWQRCSMCGR